MKKLLFVFSAFCFVIISILCLSSAEAAEFHGKGKILFIPQDDRPTSGEVSAEAISMLGYEVVLAPKELLGSSSRTGNPGRLAEWAKEHAKGVVAAVVSSDAMIYGGLTASRTHELSAEELNNRVENIVSLKKENPALNIYAFGSLMRTPVSPGASGGEEPEYYKRCGREIFLASGLLDKKDIQGLSEGEEKQLNELLDTITPAAWQDWCGRRKKNLDVSKKLIDLAHEGVLGYFIVGKDDNAPFSATHMEGRKLAAYGRRVSNEQFRLMTGIDEFAMLLLTRAVNKYEHITPRVKVQYNIGRGGDTVPAFSDVPIRSSVSEEITAAGGKQVFLDDEADLILLINTNPDGSTDSYHSLTKVSASGNKPRYGTKEFANVVESKIKQNYKVAVADIAFANGADNAMIKELHKRNLLMKLCAYAGWNTPTNSMGFAIGQGIIAARLSENDRKRLLMERYLIDYVYQGNIRKKVMNMLGRKYGDHSLCLNLREYENEVAEETTAMMREFAVVHLPKYDGIEQLEFYFPWHRTFIGAIVLPRTTDYSIMTLPH